MQLEHLKGLIKWQAIYYVKLMDLRSNQTKVALVGDWLDLTRLSTVRAAIALPMAMYILVKYQE